MIDITKKFICIVLVAVFSTATAAIPTVSSLLVQYRVKSTTNYLLSDLRKTHQKKQLKLSNFMANNLNSTIHADKNLITAYLKLQKNIKLSQVTPLFYCHDDTSAKAAYCYGIKAIVTYKYFNSSSFSQQIGTLLHELRHAQQYSNHNFQFPCDILQYKKQYGLTKNQLTERDADLFVAKTMQCPTCLQMYQFMGTSRRSHDGYVTKKDFEPFIEKATTYCKAHAHQDLTKINKAITSGNQEKAIKLDNQIGTLTDRMPPFF